jgi:hypothetical protein
VLGSDDGSSSLAASMSMIVELLEGWIDATAANGVRWGSHSALVATVSHFPELKTELEVLGCLSQSLSLCLMGYVWFG